MGLSSAHGTWRRGLRGATRSALLVCGDAEQVTRDHAEAHGAGDAVGPLVATPLQVTAPFEHTDPAFRADPPPQATAEPALPFMGAAGRRDRADLGQHGMSADRLYRLWRQAQMQVPRKRPRRRVATTRPRPTPPTGPNHVWAYDFLFDACANGQSLKCLTIVDEWTRECLAIDVAGSIRSGRVIEVLARLVSRHGTPRYHRSDSGQEFAPAPFSAGSASPASTPPSSARGNRSGTGPTRASTGSSGTSASTSNGFGLVQRPRSGPSSGGDTTMRCVRTRASLTFTVGEGPSSGTPCQNPQTVGHCGCPVRRGPDHQPPSPWRKPPLEPGWWPRGVECRHGSQSTLGSCVHDESL